MLLDGIIENVLWFSFLLLGLIGWVTVRTTLTWLRVLCTWALGVTVWLIMWTAIRYVATVDGVDTPLLWVFRSLLRGLDTLSEVLFSAWFILTLLVVLIFRSELKLLLVRLAKSTKSFEVSGIRIELVEPEEAVVAVTDQWWSDDPTKNAHVRDMPAGDGAMRVRPERATKKYLKAMDSIEDILSRVTTDNQATGQRPGRLKASG